MLSYLLGQPGLNTRRQLIRWEAGARQVDLNQAERLPVEANEAQGRGKVGPRARVFGWESREGLPDFDLVHSHRREVGRRRRGRAALDGLHAFNALRSRTPSRLARANPAALEINPITM